MKGIWERVKISIVLAVIVLIGMMVSRACSCIGCKAQTHPKPRRSPMPHRIDLFIDREDLTARFKDLQIRLTPKPLKMLALLAERSPRLVHKEELYQLLWGSVEPDCFPYEKQIADHKAKILAALRRALTDPRRATEDDVRNLIETQYSVGYRIQLEQKSIQVLGQS